MLVAEFVAITKHFCFACLLSTKRTRSMKTSNRINTINSCNQFNKIWCIMQLYYHTNTLKDVIINISLGGNDLKADIVIISFHVAWRQNAAYRRDRFWGHCLFPAYINGTVCVLKTCAVQMFADDTLLFMQWAEVEIKWLLY